MNVACVYFRNWDGQKEWCITKWEHCKAEGCKEYEEIPLPRSLHCKPADPVDPNKVPVSKRIQNARDELIKLLGEHSEDLPLVPKLRLNEVIIDLERMADQPWMKNP